MTLVPLLPQSTDLLARLGESALRSVAMAGIAALVMALLPAKRAAVRLRVWTGVLYVALAMPLLGILLPRLDVPIPQPKWLAAHTTSTSAIAAKPSSVTKESPVTAPDANVEVHRAPAIAHPRQQGTAQAAVAGSNSYSQPANAPEASTTRVRASLMAWISHINWVSIALTIYFMGLAMLLARLVLGIRGGRKLARNASDISPRYFPRKGEVEEPSISAALHFLSLQSKRAGLEFEPHLKESAALLVPATVGIRKPLILLPSDWRTWSREKLEAVLSHEISHVERRDALTQLLSKLHCALFWFSPLPWWLDRQIAECSEQASDEAALAGGADRTLYAETLLGFVSRMERVPGRVRWHALSMASHSSSGHAERRVDRILAWRPAASMKKSLIAASIVCAAPVIFLIASLRPSVTAQAAAEPAKAVPVSSATNRPTALPAKMSSTVRPALVSQAAPADKLNSAQPQDNQTSEDSRTINVHGGFYNSGPRYVIIHANSNSVTMSGDEEDVQHARALQGKIKGDFIWFERDEKSYVITDPAFLARVNALFAPQEELAKQQDALGRQQDELGRQQDELGRQQDDLGKKMDTVSVQVPDISPELERIQAELKQLQASGATQNQLGRIQARIGELQSRIGRLQSGAGQQQSVIGRQQSELGQKQSELGRKQGELGRQQGELGRRQGELARKASSELRSMFDDAIAKSIAKPE